MNAALLEWTAAVASLLGVWLMTRRLWLAWPVGLVSVALYALVFSAARLYSDTMLQLVFAAVLVYGWANWRAHAGQDGRVVVAPLARRRLLADVGLGVACGLALGGAMHTYTDAAMPWLDALLAMLSLVAQWWQARRHAAAWVLWIVVDLVYVGLYLAKSLHVTAGLYLVFVGLAVAGLRAWQASARPSTAPRR